MVFRRSQTKMPSAFYLPITYISSACGLMSLGWKILPFIGWTLGFHSFYTTIELWLVSRCTSYWCYAVSV